MPYKSEKIKLKGLQDRRRKLSDEQREEILQLYKTGNWSWSTLAEKYGVSKGAIGNIVSEVRKNSLRSYRKANWSNYKLDKKTRNEYTKNWRRYKQKLYLEGKLKEGNNESKDI